MKQNTFTKHAQLLSAVSVLVLSQAAFAQTTSEQAGAEQSAETEELSFDSLMTTLDENNTAVANVAPVVVEMTYRERDCSSNQILSGSWIRHARCSRSSDERHAQPYRYVLVSFINVSATKIQNDKPC